LVENFWGLDIFARRTMVYLVRSGYPRAASLLEPVREAVWSEHPTLPLANVQTLGEVYDQSMARTSFTVVMLSIAGSLALLMGAVGIYGVISYVVSQRTRELGLRIALGARQKQLIRMVLAHGLSLAGFGVAIGLLATVGLTRLLSTLLFGVDPVDPLTYAVVSVALVAVALLASYVPSRRAASVDPVEALRVE
jgi:ABC-type antimicrobial peptide transport system permease subunit